MSGPAAQLQPAAVAVGVAVGVGVPGPHEEGVPVAVAVGDGEGVGDGVPIAAAISTRPHPYTLFGGPASPHWVEGMCTAALSKAPRLAVIWCRRLGSARHTTAMAPAMRAVAVAVPPRLVKQVSQAW